MRSLFYCPIADSQIDPTLYCLLQLSAMCGIINVCFIFCMKGKYKMRFTIAIDSFKGSLTSSGAGRAAAEGIRRVYPDAEINIRPIADGGEGTTEALAASLGGTLRTVRAHDALMREVDCTYAVAGKTAVIEMAVAAGLP